MLTRLWLRRKALIRPSCLQDNAGDAAERPLAEGALRSGRLAILRLILQRLYSSSLARLTAWRRLLKERL